MIRGIVFDMDGLMFDTEYLDLLGWEHVAAKTGYDIRREIVLETVGLDAENTRKVFLRHFGEDFNFAAHRQTRVNFVHEYIEKNSIPIKKGLMELLSYLKANGYRIAVATSTERQRALYFLEKAKVLPFLDVTVCGDMVVKRKPDPEIYRKACELLALEPEECLALEDSETGILAACRAGLKTIMVPDLIQPGEETVKLIHSKAESLHEVIQLFESGKIA